MDKEKLKQDWWENPIFETLQKKFPNRDYDFQFELLVDWWLNSKKKLPKSITAFANWLKNTQPDQDLLDAARRKDNQDKLNELNIREEVNLEGLEKLRKIKNEIYGQRIK